jgi:catechol 2,3-dioxygenase-like lactoylglutathione lyase family enzyme
MEWKLEVVRVPVADVDRAKRFYSEQAGFVVDLDRQISDDTRIVQLTPRGSACSIVLLSGSGGMRPGSLEGLQLVVPDIEAARAELVARGVEASAVQHFEAGAMVPGRGDDWNSFIFFSDPDGNAWTVQEHRADA